VKEEFIIVLDQGSSSSRALAFDLEGNIRFKARKKIVLGYPRPGCAEYDGLELLKSQTDSLKEVLAGLPRGAGIRALGLAAQRSTVVFWDKETGRPLAPVLSWQDGRAQAVLDGIPVSNTAIHELTGLYKTPYYSASKIAWCLENVPEVKTAAAAGRLLVSPVSGFILWHLSKGKIFALDPTQAQRTLLFNIKRLKWDAGLLGAFGVGSGLLPEILPSIGDFGRINIDGFDIPVRAVLGDQQAALLGLGARSENSAALNYGTGAFLLVNTGSRLVKTRGILNSIGWQEAGAKKPCYFLESTVNSAATALEWLKIKFGMFNELSEVDAMCRLSRNRLLCLPAIGGLGSPYWDFSAFTTFTGFSPGTDKHDVVRSVVEGIAYLVGDPLDLIRKKGFNITEIRASGGLSNIDWLLQFQADLTGARVLRMEDTEATALGAAIGAARASGIELPGRLKVSKEFSPAFHEAERAGLIKGWRAFVRDVRRTSRGLRKTGVLPHG
jgi:glycerol kinase